MLRGLWRPHARLGVPEPHRHPLHRVLWDAQEAWRPCQQGQEYHPGRQRVGRDNREDLQVRRERVREFDLGEEDQGVKIEGRLLAVER